MKKIVAILLSALTLFGCLGASNKKGIVGIQLTKNGLSTKVDTNKFLLTKLKVEELKFIHTFVNPVGEVLGKLYGKEIVDSIYSDFLIVKEIKGKLSPIYIIEKSTFQNTNGKENLPINSEDFYGYHILVMVNDDMGIEPLVKINGKILKGDPITIKWDESNKVFKVLLTP